MAKDERDGEVGRGCLLCTQSRIPNLGSQEVTEEF